MKFTHRRLYSALASIIALALPAGVWAGKKSEETYLQKCGANSICPMNIYNAVGDPLDIDMKGATIEDLGTIQTEETKEITLPYERDSKTVYSYKPTAGMLGKEKKTVNILFFNIPSTGPGTKLAEQHQIQVYGHLNPESKTPWREVAVIEIDKKDLTATDTTTKIVIKPDGSATWTNPRSGKVTAFQLEYLDPDYVAPAA